MAKYLVETYYTCSFKVNHYLDSINEKELNNLEKRDDGKFEILDIKLDSRKTKNLDSKNKDSDNKKMDVPHMGWNDTEIVKEHGLMKDFTEAVFYYLHSFHMKINNSEKEVITSKCNYGGIGIVSSIQKNNIYAVQFHPEKSQENGLKLLKNFCEWDGKC